MDSHHKGKPRSWSRHLNNLVYPRQRYSISSLPSAFGVTRRAIFGDKRYFNSLSETRRFGIERPRALAHVKICKTDWIFVPNRATSSGPVTSGVGLITRGRLTVNMCQVLSSDDGKGPKLNTLAKHYLPTSSADDCSAYMT
jgi:hypothetical protein